MGYRNSISLIWLLSSLTGSQKFKMEAVKLEKHVSQLVNIITKDFQQPTPHSFGVQRFDGATANNTGCNRKPEFQYGGRRTGCTFISAPIWDRIKISTNPTL